MVDPRITKIVTFCWPNQFTQSSLKVIGQTLSDSRLLFIATQVELVYSLLQWPCFLSSPSVWGGKLADLPVLFCGCLSTQGLLGIGQGLADFEINWPCCSRPTVLAKKHHCKAPILMCFPYLFQKWKGMVFITAILSSKVSSSPDVF